MQEKVLVHSLFLVFLSSVLLFSQELQEGTALYPSACLSVSLEQEKQLMQTFIKASFLLFEHENGKEVSSAQWQECTDGLRMAIQSQPDSVELMNCLIDVRRASGTVEELATDFQLALDKNPRSYLMTVMKAELLHEAGKVDECEKMLEQYLSQNHPWPLSVVVAYFTVLNGEGKYSEADKFLAKALEDDKLKEDLNLHLCLAEELWKRCQAISYPDAAKRLKARVLTHLEAVKDLDTKKGQTQETALEYSQILKDSSLFYRYTNLLVNLEEWSELQGLLDNPRLDRDIRQSLRWQMLSWLVLRQLGKTEQLHAILEDSAKYLPEQEDEVVEFYVSICEKENLLHLAIAGQMQLYLRHPERIPIRIDLARFYLLDNKPRHGLAILQGVANNLPPTGVNILSVLHAQNKQYGKACQDMARLESLLKSHPESRKALDVDFYLRYAIYAEEAGQLDLALDKLKWAYRQFPDSIELCNSYGYVLADHNQELPFACTLIEKAVAGQPDSVAYLDSLAWVYYRLQRYQEALQVIQKILPVYQENDHDGTLGEHIGAIFHACGYAQLARNFWQEALPRSEGTVRKHILKFLDETNATLPTEK